MPGRWLLLSSAFDITVMSTLMLSGTLMSPLAPVVLGSVAGATVVFALVLDFVKFWVFRRLGIA
jgi:H+-transporting ATPase